jgi:hypothetical protein
MSGLRLIPTCALAHACGLEVVHQSEHDALLSAGVRVSHLRIRRARRGAALKSAT